MTQEPPFQILVRTSFYVVIAKLTKRQPEVSKEIAVNSNRAAQRQSIENWEVLLLRCPHFICHTGEPTATR